jgi:nucleoside-diphosphate-sugar epimerase
MRVLVTGHRGYIGAVMVPRLLRAGHDVVGLDTDLYAGCDFGEAPVSVPSLAVDVRDVEVEHCRGFDAVIHLAALSNDPLGDLDPQITYDINHRASVRLAECAKAAGVGRYLFSSSCSLYGASGDEALTEEAAFNPQTPYGESKIRTEQDVTKLADASFTPTYLRNATVYGISPRLRGDLVVNNLVGYALTTGEVLIKSDGSPWRPLVHVEDLCIAFEAVLAAPREAVHDQAFNVGRQSENFQIRQVADLVEQAVEGSRVTYAPGASPDTRNYRVDFTKIETKLPGYRPQWTLRRGIDQIVAAYREHGMDEKEFLGPRYYRIQTVKGRLAAGTLGDDLRPVR